MYQIQGPVLIVQHFAQWIREEFGLDIKLAFHSQVIDHEIFIETEINRELLNCSFELPNLSYYAAAHKQIEDRLQKLETPKLED